MHHACSVCFVCIVIIKREILWNTLFASALSVLKGFFLLLLCVVWLCKLLFELNTLQTDQFSCYSSKQELEMSEVTAPASALGSNVFSGT